jgi:hypothetical protein
VHHPHDRCRFLLVRKLAVRRCTGRGTYWDLVFMCAPYDDDLSMSVLDRWATAGQFCGRAPTQTEGPIGGWPSAPHCGRLHTTPSDAFEGPSMPGRYLSSFCTYRVYVLLDSSGLGCRQWKTCQGGGLIFANLSPKKPNTLLLFCRLMLEMLELSLPAVPL